LKLGSEVDAWVADAEADVEDDRWVFGRPGMIMWRKGFSFGGKDMLMLTWLDRSCVDVWVFGGGEKIKSVQS
jgi:hypothetical protein